MPRQKTLANLAKVRETGSTWEFHIPRIDTWGYLAGGDNNRTLSNRADVDGHKHEQGAVFRAFRGHDKFCNQV
jgi:hypothetical protein